MSGCTEFDRDLIRLAAGEIAPAGRVAAVTALRNHALCCSECGGTRDLLELLALPGGEREIAPAPDESYWTDFDRRLRGRLEREDAGTRPRAWRRPTVAAALVGFLLVAAWLVARQSRQASEPDAAAGMPQALVAGLLEADPESLAAELGDLAGWGGVGPEDEPEAAEWLPDLGTLEPETRRALLLWLRQGRSS